MPSDRCKRLEEYGLIGDLQTTALVADDGSIDWCCLPDVDSASVFARILDPDIGGHFSLSPLGEYCSLQEYLPRSNVLVTNFTSDSSVSRLTDFMPVRPEDAQVDFVDQAIYRRLECVSGTMDYRMEFEPRPDYARGRASLKSGSAGILGEHGGRALLLQGGRPLIIEDDRAELEGTLVAGESVWFVMRYGSDQPVSEEECERHLKETLAFWDGWAHRCEPVCVFDGPWHQEVERSALALKLLTHPRTGAIVAAPTSSIPEVLGGIRNWDYRYAWIRDSAFTVQAFYNLGHVREAKDFLRWAREICAGQSPENIKIMYRVHGGSDLDETELTHLSGYCGSRPVRIGNGAADQRQLDIYGELVSAFYETSRYGEALSDSDWDLVHGLVDHVTKIWEEPDSGIWEVRGEPQHFTYSKLMCWVALDRGVSMATNLGHDGPRTRWSVVADHLKNVILERGYDESIGSFTQAFGAQSIDATSLLIPIRGLLPIDDPRVQSTIDVVLQRLTTDGLVYRYVAEDGLPGEEGAFVICTFWLVRALALSGRTAEAEKVFTDLTARMSPVGLLAEEIDPASGRQLGNFPQAFSHIGLINSALYLGRAKGMDQMGPSPEGTREA